MQHPSAAIRVKPAVMIALRHTPANSRLMIRRIFSDGVPSFAEACLRSARGQALHT